MQNFSEEVKEGKVVILEPVNYNTYLQSRVSAKSTFLSDKEKSVLSEVTDPKFSLDEILNVKVMQSMYLL